MANNQVTFTPTPHTGGIPGTPQVDVQWDVTSKPNDVTPLVKNSVKIYGTIRGNGSDYAWPLLSVIDYVGNGSTGQHVAGYLQGIRRTSSVGGSNTNPEIWAGCFETIDMTNQPSGNTGALTAIEVDLRGNNVDNKLNSRQVISVNLSTYNSGGPPMQVSRGISLNTDGKSQYKRHFHPTGDYGVASIDLRDARDNGFGRGSRANIAVSLASPSNTIQVTDVMPFTSDYFARDLKSIPGLTMPVYINGARYVQTDYNMIGNGPGGTITVQTAVNTSDGTINNPVRNTSHTLWLGSGQTICFSTLGNNYMNYDSGINALTYVQDNKTCMTLNSESLDLSSQLGLTSFTVGILPITTRAGRVAFASNARNPGEGAGAGTGCPVFTNSAGTWLCFSTGLAPTV
jgi:hypothetical protein